MWSWRYFKDVAYLPGMYCLIKTGILGGEIIPLDHDVLVCGPIYVEWVCMWWWIFGGTMVIKGVTWRGWKHETLSYFAPWGDTSLFWTLKTLKNTWARYFFFSLFFFSSLFFLFLTRTQASFASTYQEINNKDCWSNLLNDNDRV
jgi:hypothetical protein